MLLILIFLLTACDPIPVKEMVTARSAISEALSVKADKYAPEELQKAQKFLMQSHDHIAKRDMKKTTDSAVTSKKWADAAYKKAIPLLARDTILMAEKSIAEADKLYGEKFAPQYFNKSKEYLKNAKNNNKKGKFYDAYVLALKADVSAKKAIKICLSQKSILSDSIAMAKINLKKAKSYNAEKYAPEKYNLATQYVATSETYLNNNELKKCFSAVEIATLNSSEALVIAMKKSAEERKKDAALLLAKAKISKGAKFAKDEMDGASEAFKMAEKTISEVKYTDSINYSEKSIRLSKIVLAYKASVGKDSGRNLKIVTYRYYIVKKKSGIKDCLRNISKKYYGDARKWKRIYKANKKRIKNPDLIYPGWKLRIPVYRK